MTVRTVRDVLAATHGSLVTGDPHREWSGVSIDSRTLRPGNLFVALHGPRFDGHTFLKTVADMRASVCLIDRLDPSLPISPDANTTLIQVPDTLRALQQLGGWIRQQARSTTVIGLTGSNGKTTTKEMLTLILRRAGKTLATRGNLNNHIGMPLMLASLDGDETYALLELGTSVPGDMDVLLEGLQPRVGIITNVGKDHLEFFGTVEGVFQENRKLFDRLPPEGTAIINLDDPIIRDALPTLQRKRLTYGVNPKADISASDIQPYPLPLRFNLKIGTETFPVKLQAPGSVQVLNALAAAATAFAVGIPPQTIIEGLEEFRPSAMRMEAQTLTDGTILVQDAYNANPSSMRASIDSFCVSYPTHPRWLVLADMRELGPGARDEHRLLGEWVAGQPVDRLFLYGRDARFIASGAQGKGFQGKVERFSKKRYLLESLKGEVRGSSKKPAILFKASRRMKLEQVSHALSSLQA